jgi:hypothetical protein
MFTTGITGTTYITGKTARLKDRKYCEHYSDSDPVR